MRFKKNLYAAFAVLMVFALFCACDGVNGNGGNGTVSTATNGGVPGTVSQVDVMVSERNMQFLGEGEEEFEGTTYTVKKYADVLTPEPYFYIYYKFYYLNDKLRIVYQFNHGVGCCTSCPYTEFEEHNDPSTEFDSSLVYKKRIYFYESTGILSEYRLFGTYDEEHYICFRFWSNGNIKYDASYYDGKITSEYFYSEDGGCLLYFTNSYYNGLSFISYYDSGFIKYYYSENVNFSKNSQSYSGSYLITFEDGVTDSPSTYGSDESKWSFEEMTVEQARAMYAQLKAELE